VVAHPPPPDTTYSGDELLALCLSQEESDQTQQHSLARKVTKSAEESAVQSAAN